MAHYFTYEENLAYEARQPRKQTGVMVAFRDAAGHILLTKPNYKPGWNLVGGILDAGEGPLDCALRETKEEIGITLTPDRLTLLGVQYLPPGKYEDFLRILFTAKLTPAEIASIKVQTSELDEVQWVTLDELAAHTERPVTQGLHALLSSGHVAGYLEGTQLKGTQP